MNENINPAVKLVGDKTNYINSNITYLKNIRIAEYDIQAAGFSVVKFLKLLSDEEISRLEGMTKEQRNIAIGLHIKRMPIINEKILTTLGKVRQGFVLLNNISINSILSIKKDALFIIKEVPTILNIKEYFQFRVKGVYTSYAFINRKEFYYSSYDDTLTLKGFDKDALKYSQGIQKSIKKIFSQAEKFSPDVLYTVMKSYTQKYLNRELPIEDYRELETGAFRYNGYLLRDCNPEMLPDIDISQNYMKYLLPLIQNII